MARRWRDLDVTRISLGVQSLDHGVLKTLGRACDPATARQGLARACKIFPRVSADWILGPGLQEDALFSELTEAVNLGVEHFSVYILELHPGTRLASLAAQGAWRPASDFGRTLRISPRSLENPRRDFGRLCVVDRVGRAAGLPLLQSGCAGDADRRRTDSNVR